MANFMFMFLEIVWRIKKMELRWFQINIDLLSVHKL